MKWMVENKKFVLIGLALLVGGFVFFLNQQQELDLVDSFSMEMEPTVMEEVEVISEPPMTQEVSPAVYMVDIKGSVKQPGVYEVLEGERIIDVIEKAGGLAKQADQTKVNLSKKVTDEMVIYVPKKGEKAPDIFTNEVLVPTSGTETVENPSSKININTADSTQLETLPGIGPQKATAIIDYRSKNGPFQKLEDLLNVSGIGEKTYEKFKDQISL